MVSSIDNEKLLIVSPQGGFGNRLRTLCSALVLGKYLNRKVYHLWINQEITDKKNKHSISHLSNISNVLDMQKISFSNIFDEKYYQLMPSDIKIDICFSEWLSSDYWFQYQSSGYRNFGNNCDIIHIGDNADMLLNCNHNVILLETSHIVKLSKYNKCWENEIENMYKSHFHFLEKYRNRFTQNIDVGISIRCLQLFLVYFPESYVKEDDIIVWINKIKSSGKSVIIFSDDENVRKHIQNSTCFFNDFDRTGLCKYEEGIIEFMILSQNCKHIYGTCKSSFAEEAAKFGSKKYDIITAL
jgi:hypothetical protein